MPPGLPKETTLERADLAFQLLMFVTTKEERKLYPFSGFPVFLASEILSSERLSARPDHDSPDQQA